MTFPQYRKYKGIEVYFKVLSDDELVELKKLGDKVLYFELKAKQFPEKLFIQDVLNNEGGRWESIKEEDFKKIEQKLKQ